VAINEELRERLRSDIANHCTAIEDLFVAGAKVTVLVRNPAVPGDADVLVTNDTDDEILTAIQRRISARAGIGVGAMKRKKRDLSGT
jgi:hypothetical protein